MQEQKDIQLGDGSVKQQISALPEDQVQQLVKQANQWADYTKFTQLMNQIAGEMKEIPELPSEKVTPEDSNSLLKVEFPQEGGVLTWMEKYKYPFRGYPHYEFVEKIDFIKKVNRAFASGLYHQLKSLPKIYFLTILPGLWMIKNVVRAWVYVFYRHIERFRIKQERYCVFVRELHSSFGESELDKMIRDLLCMILEFDNAYRFRAQDILSELDKESLQKHPSGELLRLLKMMMGREKTQEIRDTWTLVQLIVRFYLWFDRPLIKLIKNALLRIDLEKVRLTVEDKEYCVPRKDYTFGFMINPDEEDALLLRQNMLKVESREKVLKIQDESTKAHEELLRENPTKEQILQLNSKYEKQLKEVELNLAL